MPTFEEYVAALQARDTIKQLVRTEMASMRPEYRYATVVSIDRQAREAVVQFPEGGDPATVQMGGLQPAAVGQVVRIDGLSGDRFVADVMGPVYSPETDGRPQQLVKPVFQVPSSGADPELTQSGWNNSIVNSAAYLGGYDQSSGALGAYKDRRVFLEPGLWHATSYFLKGPNVGDIYFRLDPGLPTQYDFVTTVGSGYNASYILGALYHGAIQVPEPRHYIVRAFVNSKHASSSSYFGLLSMFAFYYGGS